MSDRYAVFKNALDEFGRERYEEGFAAAEKRNRERNLTPARDIEPEIAALVDELQLFRQQFNVNDTRYSALGEIIAKFNAVLIGKPEEKGVG